MIRTRRRTTALALAAAIVAAALGAAVPAGPASAGIDLGTAYPRDPALTWVDDTGAQYVVSSVMVSTEGSSGTFDLVIARVRPDGTPDPAWGSYSGGYGGALQVGVRELELQPPADGLARTMVAADDDGTLTVTWVPASCHVLTCDTWFSRHDTSGAQVATPVLVEGNEDRPLAPLPDGSFRTVDVGGTPGWRGPDGVDRGFPPLDSEEIGDITVDGSGRLLVSTLAHRVLRWPAGGPVDLELDDVCDHGAVRLGRSGDDDTFATVCTPTPTQPVEVHRRDADGDLAWSATAPALQPEGQLSSVSAVLVDGAGRVWVGGTGQVFSTFAGFAQAELLQAFSAEEASAVTAWRAKRTPPWYEFDSGGIDELRPAPDGRVGYLDVVACCQHPAAGLAPWSHSVAGIAEATPLEPPTCTVVRPALDEVTRTSARLAFEGCTPDYGALDRFPSRYVVEVRSGDLPVATTDHPERDGLSPFEVPVALAPGVLSTVTVAPGNRAGVAAAASTTTFSLVAPLPTVAAFVDRQIADLVRPTTSVPRATVIAAVTDGTTSPVQLVDGWLDAGLGPAAQDIRPVARLYEAFFLRGADTTGLRYWVEQRRKGQRLVQAADRFAASSEFRRRYGSLSDQSFVAQLYRNVFDREADPSGLAYWTRKLRERQLSRGGVVAQFSESSENLRRSTRFVDPVAATFLMLGRVPTASQRTTWAATPDPQGAAVAEILASESYAARVTGT